MQDSQGCVKRIGGICRHPPFPKSSTRLSFKVLRFVKNVFRQTWFCIRLGIFGVVSPRIQMVGVGAQGQVQKSRNHRNEEFEALPQANRKL